MKREKVMNGDKASGGKHGDSLILSSGVQKYHVLSAENPESIFFSDEEKEKIGAIIKRYRNKRSAVMPILWIAQEKFGWLSKEAIELVSTVLGLNLADVHGVASFYTMYFKKPRGNKHLAVCTNISCMLSGGYKIYNYLRETYSLENGSCTKDGSISLEEAECLGSCGTAPVIQVNNKSYLEKASIEKLKSILG